MSRNLLICGIVVSIASGCFLDSPKGKQSTADREALETLEQAKWEKCRKVMGAKPYNPHYQRFHVETRQFDDVQVAYLAALIDGEGCLCLSRTKLRGANWESKNYTYRASLQITMVSKMLCNLPTEFGVGCTHFIKKPDPRHQDCWMWLVSSNGLRALLPQVLPHLRIKRRQAECLLEFLELANRFVRNAPDPSVHHGRVGELYLEMKRLNLRGRHGAIEKLAQVFDAGSDAGS